MKSVYSCKKLIVLIQEEMYKNCAYSGKK
jgi:hypothetical protein